jgi:hypothetical protein
MTQSILPVGTNRILIVEGRHDKEFFIRLAQHLGIVLPQAFYIKALEGIDNLRDELLAQLVSPHWQQLQFIGIVRDADFAGGVFGRVQDVLRNANHQAQTSGLTAQYPIPNAVLQPEGTTLKIAVLILPDANAVGSLENVILNAFATDPLMICASQFIQCVESKTSNIVQGMLSKTQLQAFIGAKNLDNTQSNRDDRELSYTSDLYKMTWWKQKPELWNHAVFDEIKIFLQTLANA